MPPSAVNALIAAGPEAASAQVQEIADFKRAMSKITLDMDTRVLTVTFKGRRTAARWIGWKIPLATRMLPLIDYETVKERAKQTHELVLLDYYSFEVDVRKGKMSSANLYWLLTAGVGLKVQELTHAVSKLTGMRERHWHVRVKAAGCPDVLRNKSYISLGETEVVIHHSSTYVNWPCRTCLSPDHPTRKCGESPDSMDEVRNRYTCSVNGPASPRRGARRGSQDGHEQPTTMIQLETRLRKERAKITEKDVVCQNRTAPVRTRSPSAARKKASSPKRGSQGQAETNLTLPTEWGQSRQHVMPGPDPTKEQEVFARGMAGDFQENASKQRSDQKGSIRDPLASREDEHKESPAAQEANHDLGRTLVEDESMENNNDGEDQEMIEAEEKRPVSELAADALQLVQRKQRQERKLRIESPERGRSPTKRATTGRYHPGGSKIDYRKMNRRVLKELEQEARAKDRGQASDRTNTCDVQPTAQRSGCVSTSPKRKANRAWPEGRATGEAVDGEDSVPSCLEKATVLVRSPKRKADDKDRHELRTSTQKYIHDYMKATPEPPSPTEVTAGHVQSPHSEYKEVDGSSPSSEGSQTTSGGAVNLGTNQKGKDEEGDCKIVAVKPPTDEGASLGTWLTLIGGKIINVAANGHCGWLAYYAALYNEADGVDKPTPDVAAKTNLLKKVVLNEMLANLEEEAKLHPDEIQAEAERSGPCGQGASTVEEQLCAIANHLAEHRGKTVKSPVPTHYWVRTMHLKAMALHAREMLYVLDVFEDGVARMQAYGYAERALENGDTVESGTVTPVCTDLAMRLLTDLIEAGVRPPVLILRWSSKGNHFQAVNYPAEKHAYYAQNITALSAIRNAILVKHGWPPLDPIGYDRGMTAKAAAMALTEIRCKVRTSARAKADLVRSSREVEPRAGVPTEQAELVDELVPGITAGPHLGGTKIVPAAKASSHEERLEAPQDCRDASEEACQADVASADEL